MSQSEARLKKLEEQQKKLKEEIQLGRNRVAEEKRKQENRRKILLGATVLKRIQAGLLGEDDVRSWLDANLTRDDERKLFDLPVQPKEDTPSEPAPEAQP